MKGLFDFIANYYLWILLGLAIIFFAYIGYSAEKKGYIGKKKKNDDDLVDIDDLIKPKEEKVVTEEHEEDLSTSFDVMPEFKKKEETPVEQPSEDISEDLYAPFGDQEIEAPKAAPSVDEVEIEKINQDFVDITKIESEAKDIINGDDKKDVADLMRTDTSIDTGFEVEGATTEVKSDNVFDEVAKEEKTEKKKEEEVVDDMWKF